MTTGDNNRTGFLIVGVGASAGGLDAFQRFLSALPVDFGFALVFIQHLSSKHKSLLAELLSARRPSLVIQQISDGLKIQPGRLYLAPPGREVRLRNGLFQTAVHPEGLIHLPIDEFLSSLAEDAAERSIAVIFSGAGTDGSRGCQAIRSVGGAVFVQDPQTAEFSSMPLAAIATGQADAVLQPEGIAAELLKLQGIGPAAVHPELPITPEEYDDFFRLLQEKTGGRFDHYKKSVVGRRIRRRMDLHGFPVVKDYLDLVSTSDTEAALLASDLMIGVTSFFRDRVAWKALNLDAVRRIAAEDTGLPVRVWTPASSTGEEAYSIAMMLLRELDLAGRKRDVHVFATDVNNRALERAREGRYPAGIAADIPQEYIRKYFTQPDDGDGLVINKDVRECVVFARQDLLTDPPFSKLDLIICRNFLIYLEPEAQEKSITLFHYALKEGGYLFLGSAETVGRKNRLFQSIGHKPCRVYRKLESKQASRLPISVPYASERAVQSPKPAQLPEQKQSVTEIIQEKLLEEYGPASVAIDQNYEIIYHNGPTNRYLRQPRGVPTQNLLELVPENLRTRIRGALYRSGREERPVVIRTSMAGDDKTKRQIALRITKVSETLTIIVFGEKGASSKKEAAEAVDAAVIEESAIHQLESELSATKADLQSHIEQLKSLNEELQSSNEELQAANEELETSREELQSLNEELITVNAQLQGKVEEQEETNNDLNNFQASTNIPTVFLDHQFRVKRFTPAMARLLELIPSDVGRPLIDMSQEKLGSDLVADARTVLDSLAPVTREMKIDDTWYVRATLPYRTADNQIKGVVITYNDVTELKNAEERSRHLASFPQLNPNPVCEVHSSGKVTFCNPATEKILANLGMGGEDVAVFLPADIDDILRDLKNYEETSLYREVEIKDRVFGMIVHLAPQFNVARIYAYDITERKQAEAEIQRLAQQRQIALDAAHLGWWQYNPITRIADWDDGYKAIFGVSGYSSPNDEILAQIIHPADLPGLWAKVEATLNPIDPQTFIAEYRINRPDGAMRWIEAHGIASFEGEGEKRRAVNFVGTVADITERKKAEEALQESEHRVRLKLNSILSPEGDIGNLELGDIIDAPAIQSLMDQFYELTHIPMAVIDLKGKVLVGVGWQEICTKFHRVHPETCRYCIESDTLLTENVPAGEYKLYKCKNNMWDVATPIKVGDRHLGHFFTGQFFFDNESPDYEFFRQQAKLYGFDEQKYLAALDKVPRLSRATVDTVMAFFMKLSGMISQLSFSNIKLARILKERDLLMASLRENEERLNRAQEIAHLGSWELDLVNNSLSWSDEVYRIFGLQPQEFGATYEAFLDRVHPDDRSAVDATYSGSIRDGKDFYEIEHRVVVKSTGEVRVVHERCQHFRDESGRIIRSVGMVHDITERKQAEEALKESERRYHSLFDNMTEGFAYCKMLFDNSGQPEDFVYLEVNNSFGRLTGLSNVVGKKVSEVIPGIRETDPELFQIYGRVALTCKPERFEFYVKALKSWFSLSVYCPQEEYFVAVFDVITERKRAEESLRESEKQFRTLADSIPNLAWWANADGYITWYNQRWYEYTGTTPEQMEGWGWQSVHDPTMLPKVLERWKTSIVTGEPFEMEFPLRGADGVFRPFLTRVMPLKDSAGQLVRWFGTNTDVSGIRQAEDALRKSEERFRNMFERHRAVMLLIEPETGAIVDANASAAEFYGWPIDALCSLSIQDINQLSPDDVASERKRALEEGRNYFVFPHKLADGRVRWVEVYSSPITVQGRSLLFSIIHDITERRQAEAALHQAAETFEKVFKGNAAATALSRLEDGTFLEVNDRFLEMTGYSREEVIGKEPPVVWKNPEDRAAMIHEVQGGGSVSGLEYRILRKNGEEFVVLFFAQPITLQGQKLMISSAVDITERKRTEEALLKLNKALKALSDSSQAVILAKDELQYLNDVCRIVIEDCGYSMVWIGFAEHDEAKSIRPAAYAGFEEGYLETLNLSWADTERGRGPTGTAIRTGNVAVCRNMLTDPAFALWREEAIKRGYASSIVFPLQAEGSVIGAITMYSRDVDPFTEDEIRLLTELTDNVAYGIEVLRVRAAQKHAEDALRESEERYRNIIETASEGIWIGDFEGRTTFVNESIINMMGYSPEEVIGKTAYDFMDEEARAIARLNLEQRRRGKKNNYELKFIRKDGSSLWAIVGATPLYDKQGNAVASMAMVTDITARKLAEEKSRHQQAVLTSINRIFREALTTDSEEELGRVCLSIAEELTNSKFGFIAEIGPDGLLHNTAMSSPGWDLCTMKDKAEHRQPLGAFKVHGLVGRVIIDEQPFFTNDPYSHRDSIGTPEGHPRLTAFLGVPLVHRGKTIGLIALGNREGGYRIEDVETMEPLATVTVQALMRKRTESSLQAAHAELKQRAYELEAVNRDLEVYSYTVSHDLKAPLRSIDGFARALLEDYGDKLDSTAGDYLVRINSAAQRMDQLIQAMLDMARLTRRDLNEQSVDLSAMAQVIADDLRKQDPARMVEFIIADKIRARGDNALLQAVLENLMHNAWKFTGKQKAARIEFGVTTMHGHSVYFVKDNGAGFDMQFADKLFLPFKRLHMDSEFPGLGIGLATAYRIILRHNGRLWAESAPEQGATFYFTL